MYFLIYIYIHIYIRFGEDGNDVDLDILIRHSGWRTVVQSILGDGVPESKVKIFNVELFETNL